MSLEGVWKVELMGSYGWENFATAILQNGQYFEAGADHYSAGSYDVKDETFTLNLQVVQHGKLRTLFGAKKKKMSVQFESKIKDENKIVGKFFRSGRKKFDLKIRLTRLSPSTDLIPEPGG